MEWPIYVIVNANGVNGFCFLSSLPPSPPAATTARSCHLSTLYLHWSPVRAFLSIWYKRFRGNQNEDNRVSASIQSSLHGGRYAKNLFFIFVYFFGGLECVGHSFAYAAHFVFSRDVWIWTQRAAGASRRATNLATHLPTRESRLVSGQVICI